MTFLGEEEVREPSWRAQLVVSRTISVARCSTHGMNSNISRGLRREIAAKDPQTLLPLYDTAHYIEITPVIKYCGYVIHTVDLSEIMDSSWSRQLMGILL